MAFLLLTLYLGYTRASFTVPHLLSMRKKCSILSPHTQPQKRVGDFTLTGVCVGQESVSTILRFSPHIRTEVLVALPEAGTKSYPGKFSALFRMFVHCSYAIFFSRLTCPQLGSGHCLKCQCIRRREKHIVTRLLHQSLVLSKSSNNWCSR